MAILYLDEMHSSLPEVRTRLAADPVWRLRRLNRTHLRLPMMVVIQRATLDFVALHRSPITRFPDYDWNLVGAPSLPCRQA